MKKTIIFLSDFGYNDTYVGICKGVIKSINPDVNIIDLTHNIAPQSITEAYFVLKNSFFYFPVQSIFLAVIDPAVGSKRKLLIVQAYNKFFVGPDNGVFSFIEKQDIEKIISIENKGFFSNYPTNTFHGRHILAPICGFLSLGTPAESFGPHIESIKRLRLRKPQIKNKTISGQIIYIDHFGNLISNIEKDLLERFLPTHQSSLLAPKSNLEILLDQNIKIKGISKTYSEKKTGELLALINSFNLLEISINCGNAHQILQKGIGTKITIIY